MLSPVIDPFLVALAVKLAFAAAVVIAAALVIERSGPFLGAMIVTLPITTGPSYVFIALDHTPAFLGETALASLAANAAIPGFMTAYAALARRCGVLASLGLAYAVWVLVAAASLHFERSLALLVSINIAAYAAGWLVLRHHSEARQAARAEPRWWDLPARALAVMAVSAAVILTARALGPHVAGLVAIAPMGFTTMALVLHPRIGGAASAALFANALPGMIGFVLALLTVHLLAVRLGSWWSLLAGLGVSMAWNGVLILGRLLVRRW